MDNCLRYLILSNGFLIMFYGFYRLFLSGETHFVLNRFILLSGVILSVILPLIQIDWFFVSPAGGITIPIISIPATHTTTPLILDEVIVSGRLVWRPDIIQAIIFLYGMGVTLMTFRALASLFRIWQWRIKHPDTTILGVKATLLPDGYPAFSFLRRIYLPSSLNSTESGSDISDMIIRHETAHIRQWHTLDILLIELIQILFFYNPVVYLLKRQMQLNHEYLADRAIHPQDRYLYSLKLLYSQFQLPRLSMVHSFNQKLLIKRRFTMLLNQTHNRWAALKYFLILPLIAALVWFTACTKSSKSETDHPDYQKMSKTEIAQMGIEKEFLKAGLSREDITMYQRRVASAATTQSPGLTSDGEAVFYIVDQMPSFQGGGLEEFRNWVQMHIKYPPVALENGISGTVYVNFIVGKDGKIKDIKLVRGVDTSLDDAVVQILKDAPAWKPGYQKGKPVNVSMAIPVRFALQ